MSQQLAANQTSMTEGQIKQLIKNLEHVRPSDPLADSPAAFEVNFMPDYKHLDEAGYNVLCYDTTRKTSPA